MNYGCSTGMSDEVTSKFLRLLIRLYAVSVSQGARKREKREIENATGKRFEHVQIKPNILITRLHVLLNILIMWMFTLCMIVAEYFTISDAQNVYNTIIHNRFFIKDFLHVEPRLFCRII